MVVGCLAFMNALLTMLTKLQSGEHDKHHIFDNISGYVIIGYRLLLLIVFVFATLNTYVQSRTKVKNFVLVFGVFGALYIAAMPIIVLIGNTMIAPKDRHEFVFVAI